MTFKMKPVDKTEFVQLLTEPSGRRSGRGQELLDEFLSSGEAGAVVQLSSTKERNAVAISLNNAVRRTDSSIWVRKLGGGTGTDLLLVNLNKADAATQKAYENRPRVGRRKAS